MSKKVECGCVVPEGFPRTNTECALGDNCVDDCTNCTIGWIPNIGCEECHGTGKVKLRVPLSKSGRSVGIVCRVCGRYQRVSMGSECQQASACSRHLEIRV